MLNVSARMPEPKPRPVPPMLPGLFPTSGGMLSKSDGSVGKFQPWNVGTAEARGMEAKKYSQHYNGES